MFLSEMIVMFTFLLLLHAMGYEKNVLLICDILQQVTNNCKKICNALQLTNTADQRQTLVTVTVNH